MNANLIVVTGCFGAPVKEKSLELARQRGLPLVDLDNPDTDYLRREILLMYANPLYNYYKATGEK